MAAFGADPLPEPPRDAVAAALATAAAARRARAMRGIGEIVLRFTTLAGKTLLAITHRQQAEAVVFTDPYAYAQGPPIESKAHDER